MERERGERRGSNAVGWQADLGRGDGGEGHPGPHRVDDPEVAVNPGVLSPSPAIHGVAAHAGIMGGGLGNSLAASLFSKNNKKNDSKKHLQ